MKSTYFPGDDILQIRVADKPIVHEVSQGWHTNISCAQRLQWVEQCSHFVRMAQAAKAQAVTAQRVDT